MNDIEILSDPVLEILEGLNPEQKEAVTFEKGPLLIIAGAGTGKTSVITRRIAYLITKHLAQPDEILALTYTEKAAAEMADRVDRLVPYGYAPVWISTFHAFGDKLLRRHALEMGMPLHFDVLDELQQKIFLLENLWKLPLNLLRPSHSPLSFLDEISKLISRAKDEDITPEEYLNYCNEAWFEDSQTREKNFEIAGCYQMYQKLLRDKGFIDFGDQVSLTVQLFRKNPAILNLYRKQFKYILVDEFQDTNYVQFVLLQLLANDENNITVVGDDDQSIYRFRGASLANILKFSDIYPDCHKVVLTENYRSGQKILDAAYNLIGNNNPDRLEIKEGLSKKLTGRTQPDSLLIHRRYSTRDVEADEVAKEILRLVKEEEYSFSDIAVLIRKINAAEPYLESFRYYGIPLHFAAQERFFRRPEILWMISFVHTVSDPQDSIHLFNLLSSPFYEIPAIDLSLLGGYSKNSKRSLFYVIKHRTALKLRDELSEKGEKILRKFLKDLDTFAEKTLTLKTGEVIYDFLESSGYLKALVKNESPESEEIARNLSRFFNHVKAFSRATRKDDLHSFAEHLSRLHDLGEEAYLYDSEPGENIVRVMTVHRAKGLEFPVVFLPGLVQTHFPDRDRPPAFDIPEGLIKEGSMPRADHKQEERRLFYVAMTRAKDRLYLSSAEDYGTAQKRKMSQFIAEALKLKKQEIAAVQSDPLSVIRFHAPPHAPLLHLNLEPMPPDAVLDLSYHQVNEIQSCPLRYKINHVLKIPTRSAHYLVLGLALHKAIETLLMMKKVGRLPFWNEVEEAYDRAWISEGFLSREHEEQRKEEGRVSLQKFYERELEDPVVPFLIEEEFSFHHNQIRLRGRWDRVDFDGKRAIVIDYKSSNVQEQEKANQKVEDTLQLYIYALAFHQRYGIWPEAMELRFIDSGLVGRVEFQHEELAKIIEKIEAAADQIRKREFPPKPEYQNCRFCQVRQICSFSAY